jgi:hypothetical protein
MYTPILILIPHINRIGNSTLNLVLKKKNPPIKKQWPEPSQGRQKGGGQKKAKRHTTGKA